MWRMFGDEYRIFFYFVRWIHSSQGVFDVAEGQYVNKGFSTQRHSVLFILKLAPSFLVD